MAKQPPVKGGSSRIRFIMLEADIPEGDLGQITAAIQNALRPTTTIIQQRLPQPAGSLASPSLAPELDAVDEREPQPQPQDDRQAEMFEPKPAREPRVRKPTPMKVLPIDLVSDPSFESFATKHPPKNDVERNLVALAWFKQHRPNEEVTPNHVYTCYRAMKWPSGIDDFGSILRNLKHSQVVMSPARGQYEINHLGEARVEEIGARTA